MRITNAMMTNNILISLNKNRVEMERYDQMLSSGKKIQKPSDDPIVAVRALKFRTSVNEIEQFKTNSEDAISWLSVSEQAISNTTDMAKRLRDLCVQAASDNLTTSDRRGIVSEMKELKTQIANEGNASYAGRYVFSGFMTDKSLVYKEGSLDSFDITEHLTPANVETVQRVNNGSVIDVSRMRLGYSNISPTTVPATVAGFTVNTMTSGAANALTPAAGTINFLTDTGELIFNKTDAATATSTIPATFDFKYNKTNFQKGDIFPGHYFDSTDVTPVTGGSVYTANTEDLKYQVSYSQEIAVNVQGRDVITKDLLRDIEEIVNQTLNITDDTTLNNQLKSDILGNGFDKMLGKIDKHIETIVNKRAEIGSKVNRLDLTINRLEADGLNFTDLMSNNEDADMAEAMIKFKSMETIYNASLMSSAKIIQPTLLDFVR